MYPNLFGIENSSYSIMLMLGIFSAFGLFMLYAKKKRINSIGILDTLIATTCGVAAGIGGANLTQNFYNWIYCLKNNVEFRWTTGLTFYGGLFFGVVVFFVVFLIATRKDKSISVREIMIIGPACVTLAHAFGRIGCLLAGCCYGGVTESWIGLPCSAVDSLNHVPTQLYESIFLFLLSGLLTVLAFTKDFKYNFIIYLPAYAVWRFVIELFRDDYRGTVGALTPSQIWCIVLFVGSIPLYFLIRFVLFKQKKEETYEQK